MERARVWHGTVDQTAREEHERFVDWLRTDEAAVQYAKFGLTSYTLVMSGDSLAITIGTDSPDPTTLIRFLRNHRMWPEFWRYESTSSEAGAAAGDTLVEWRRSSTTGHLAASQD